MIINGMTQKVFQEYLKANKTALLDEQTTLGVALSNRATREYGTRDYVRAQQTVETVLYHVQTLKWLVDDTQRIYNEAIS